MRCLIIIPTYNERDSIGGLVPEIFRAFPSISVLVVDDSSPDGTGAVVAELQKQYPALFIFRREKKEGLCAAYVAAFEKIFCEHPEFNVVLTMDADWSHDPVYISKLLEAVQDADVAVGSRYIHGGKTEGWEWNRKLLSRFGNRYAKMITRIPVHDLTAGFTAMRVEKLMAVDFKKLLMFTGYAYTIALKYYLWKSGARLKEIPIIFRNRSVGKSKISKNIISEGLFTPWRLISER